MRKKSGPRAYAYEPKFRKYDYIANGKLHFTAKKNPSILPPKGGRMDGFFLRG